MKYCFISTQFQYEKNTFKVILSKKNLWYYWKKKKIYHFPSDKTCARRVARRRVDPSRPGGKYSQLKRFIINKLLIPWNIVLLIHNFSKRNTCKVFLLKNIYDISFCLTRLARGELRVEVWIPVGVSAWSSEDDIRLRQN